MYLLNIYLPNLFSDLKQIIVTKSKRQKKSVREQMFLTTLYKHANGKHVLKMLLKMIWLCVFLEMEAKKMTHVKSVRGMVCGGGVHRRKAQDSFGVLMYSIVIISTEFYRMDFSL